jgi:hypothetical protein
LLDKKNAKLGPTVATNGTVLAWLTGQSDITSTPHYMETLNALYPGSVDMPAKPATPSTSSIHIDDEDLEPLRPMPAINMNDLVAQIGARRGKATDIFFGSDQDTEEDTSTTDQTTASEK